MRPRRQYRSGQGPRSPAWRPGVSQSRSASYVAAPAILGDGLPLAGAEVLVRDAPAVRLSPKHSCSAPVAAEFFTARQPGPRVRVDHSGGGVGLGQPDRFDGLVVV